MSEQGKISIPVAVLMNINIIVGAGIYMLPQMMAQTAGSLSFLGWVGVGLLFLPVVWTVATAARLFPGTGGFYNYCSQGIGRQAGFIALWCYILGFFAVPSSQLAFFLELASDKLGWTFITQMPIATNAIFIALLFLLNLLSIDFISRIQGVVTVLKILPMLLVLVLIPFFWNSSLTYDWGNFSAIGATLPMALFGYWGFESCTSIGQYLKGGPAKASSVMLTAFFSTMVLYCSFHFGVLNIMGTENLTLFNASAFPEFLGISAPTLLSLMKWGVVGAILLALFNAVYGVMLGNVSNLTSLASRGHFLASKALTVTNRFNRPYLLVAVQAVVMFSMMSFIPNQKILLVLSNFGLISANFLTHIAVLNAQRKRGFSLNMLVTLLGFASCGVLAYYSWLVLEGQVIYFLPFVAALAVGYGMFRITEGTAAQ